MAALDLLPLWCCQTQNVPVPSLCLSPQTGHGHQELLSWWVALLVARCCRHRSPLPNTPHRDLKFTLLLKSSPVTCRAVVRPWLGWNGGTFRPGSGVREVKTLLGWLCPSSGDCHQSDHVEQNSQVLAHWGHCRGCLGAPSCSRTKQWPYCLILLPGNPEWNPCSQAAPWACHTLSHSLSFWGQKN